MANIRYLESEIDRVSVFALCVMLYHLSHVIAYSEKWFSHLSLTFICLNVTSGRNFLKIEGLHGKRFRKRVNYHSFCYVFVLLYAFQLIRSCEEKNKRYDELRATHAETLDELSYRGDAWR